MNGLEFQENDKSSRRQQQKIRPKPDLFVGRLSVKKKFAQVHTKLIKFPATISNSLLQ